MPPWPKYNKNTNQAMVFDKTSQKEILPAKDELDFLLSKAGQ
jgi:hypothetical protein